MKRGISYHVSGNKFGDKTCCSNQIGCTFLFLMTSGFEQIILNHFAHCRWPNSSCFLKIILFVSFSIAILEIFKFTNILVYVLKDDDAALISKQAWQTKNLIMLCNDTFLKRVCWFLSRAVCWFLPRAMFEIFSKSFLKCSCL